MPKVGMSQIRREQLIEATLDCVDLHGVNGATISKISKQAGVSTGIVHHYFHNKDDLLEGSMRLMLAHLGHGIIKRKLLAKNHTESILAIIDGNFSEKQIERKSTKIWLSFWAEALHSEVLVRLQTVNMRRLHSNLTYHFKHLIPHEDAKLVASGMAALIDGIWLRGAFMEKGIDAKQANLMCQNYLEMVLEKYSPV
ncbi:MAG: transcriptional regulator BetI [Gammaproteobacteria bacterium]|nr:transcriptional regulator BetI [Gammaproteobacteria bacterium]